MGPPPLLAPFAPPIVAVPVALLLGLGGVVRHLTGGLFLPAGLGTLGRIVTAPVVVASPISLRYDGATVAPGLFGGGNRLLHKGVGGIGMVKGNGGTSRADLPWQAVHGGPVPRHGPLHLTVRIKAPAKAMAAVLGRHPGGCGLFGNGRLHPFAPGEGKVAARLRPGLDWELAA